MAWKGLMFNQKAVVPFAYHDDGPDLLYQIGVNEPATTVRDSLTTHGLKYRTIEPRAGDRTRVFPDPDSLAGPKTDTATSTLPSVGLAALSLGAPMAASE
jgi:hypothetical protein